MLGFTRSKPPESPEGLRYGTFHQRLFAGTIDAAIVMTVLWPAFVDISQKIYGASDPHNIITRARQMPAEQGAQFVMQSGVVEKWLEVSLIQIVVMGLIVVISWWRFQTTPGKWLLGLRLVDSKSFGNVTVGQSIRRYLGYMVSLPPMLIGLAWLSLDKKKQAWHDKMAGTLVVTRRSVREWHERQAQEAASPKEEAAEVPEETKQDD